MRLKERSLNWISILPRVAQKGELGGVKEEFAPSGVSVRASCLPEGGELEARVQGAVCPERLRLLTPGDVQVQSGDGVRMGDRLYRVMCVQRWATQLELICEAI